MPKLWTNSERTILVSQWEDGTMAVAMRDDPDATWGPPITVRPATWNGYAATKNPG